MEEVKPNTDNKTIVDCREHVLYCGVTMTGKTTLARHHARILERNHYDVVVYDPVGTQTAGGGWPDKTLIINDPERFHRFIDKAHGTIEHPIFLFVDEAADIFGHSNTEAHWIPRKVRHSNIYLRLIAQRPKMLHPNVRSQCSYAYVLRLAVEDRKTVFADFGHSGEIVETEFDKGDCILLTSGSTDLREFNVFELVGRSRAT